MDNYWGQIVWVLQELPKYNVVDDPTGEKQINIGVAIENAYAYFFSKQQDPGSQQLSFNVLYSFIKAHAINSAEEIPILKMELLKATVVYSSLTDKLRKNISETSVHRFANLFGDQGLKHSRFLEKAKYEKSKLNYLKIGSAEIWFTMGLALLVFGFRFFYDELNFEIIDSTDYKKLIPVIAKKALFITIWIFALRFSFRNYSINKNLAVINLHRRNVMNSFRLFLQSLDKEDKEIRATILSEISKSISNQNQTGYLKDIGISTPWQKLKDYISKNP